MSDTPLSSHDALVACFFETCEAVLGFLKEKHGFQNFGGLAEYRQGRKIITPYKKGSAAEGFWALSRFEKGDMALEVSFSDREYMIESHVFYGFTSRFDTGDILSAMKKSDARLESRYSVIRPELVRETVGNLAAALRAYIKPVTEPSEKLLERAHTIRHKRMEQGIRERYRRDLQQASARAARAFTAKDYRKVIEILSSYEKDLSPADLKKLALARKHFLDLSGT